MAAACRAVLRPNDSTFGYLRVGSDEFRLLITTLVIAVIFLVVGVVTFIIGGIVMAVTSGGALRGMQPGTPPPAAALGMLAVGSLPGVLVMVFLAVKLSLAGPQTVGQRAIEVFGSWTLTKGRFWKIVATFVVGLLPIILLSCISAAILLAGGTGATMREKMMSMQTDMFSLDSAFDARHLVSYLVSSVTRVLVMVSVLVPSALIYQAVKPADADVFDDDDDDDDD